MKPSSPHREFIRCTSEICEDRGIVCRFTVRTDGGVGVLASAPSGTAPSLAFVFQTEDFENGDYRRMLDGFRRALRLRFGATQEELAADREEARAELGKQRTPFRPGRHRVRLRVGGPVPLGPTNVAAFQDRRWVASWMKRFGLVPA